MTGQRVAISTQEKNPRSTIIRSVLVAVLALLPIMNGALAIIVAELAPYGGNVPGWVFAILNGGIALTAVLLAILTKIMALPGVNEWFREHVSWLAPEGKDGPEFKTAAEGVQYLFDNAITVTGPITLGTVAQLVHEADGIRVYHNPDGKYVKSILSQWVPGSWDTLEEAINAPDDA